MPKTLILSSLLLVVVFNACSKTDNNQSGSLIPNGDFETWDSNPSLAIWQTNSCPLCLPPFETYIVQKTSDHQSGNYAAKFIYNGVYKSSAQQKFRVGSNPVGLSFYTKSQIVSGDTATIFCRLTQKDSVTDSAYLYVTKASDTYLFSKMAFKQSAIQADSVFVRIEGGHKTGTELTIDNMRIAY